MRLKRRLLGYFSSVILFVTLWPTSICNAQVVINEILASNETVLQDEDGDYSDWIELFNAGNVAVDLSGWTLSDDPNNLDKWPLAETTLGPNSYLIIFASGKDRRQANSELHTNFGLGNSGEYLALFDETGSSVFEYTPDFGLQYEDVSFGLSGVTAALPGVFFASPTPGSENGIGDSSFKARSPEFSIPHGFYSSPFNLQISNPDQLSVRYTTDGSTPSESEGTLYAGPITISGSTVVRAIAFGGGFDNSDTVTNTYLSIDDILNQPSDPIGWPIENVNSQVFDHEMDPEIVNDPTWTQQIIDSFQDISTVSIVTDMYHLVDPDSGIYVNALDKWERPASLELIETDGSEGFQINAGIRIRGNSSRNGANPKHAFRFLFKKEYGPGKLEYDFFKGQDTAAKEFDKLDFRTENAYSWHWRTENYKNTLVRDVISRDLQRSLGHPATHSRYHHLFLNGLYMGVFMSQERPEASFGESYLGGDKEDYDVLKSGARDLAYATEAASGSIDGLWRDLWDLSQAQFTSPTLSRFFQMQGLNADGTNNPAYPALLDLDNLIDEMLIVFYIGSSDGPIIRWRPTGSNNWWGLKNRTQDDQGFVFVQHDTEHSFGVKTEPEDINRVGPYHVEDQGVFMHSNPQYFHQDLVPTQEYRMAMSDRAYQVFFNGGLMTVTPIQELMLNRKAQIENAIVAESARWGDGKNTIPRTKDDWDAAIDTMLANPIGRSELVVQQLRDAGIYPSINPPEFSSGYNQYEGEVAAGFQLNINNSGNSDLGSIRYTIDGSDPRAVGGADQGILGNDNVNLTISGTMTINARVLENGEWSALQTATFYAPQMLDKLVINEIHYNPLDEGTVGLPGYVDGDEFEFVEIKNTAAVPLQLQGVEFIGGIEYTFPAGATIPADDFVVLAENAVEFENRYGFAPDGQYSEKLSNSGEQLILQDYSGSVLDSLSYGDSDPWTELADGEGPSLSLDPIAVDNNNVDNWFSSTDIGGTPKAENALDISIVLLAPANNSGQASDSDVLVSARVYSGGVVTVDVYVDGVVVGQMTADPNDSSLYTYSISGLNDGVYTIDLTASNSSGQSDSANSSLICIGVIGEGPFMETGGQVVFEAENFVNKIDRGVDAWEESSTIAGSIGSYMVTVPDDGTKVTTGYASTVAELQYLVNFETSGTYYLWYRGWADDGGNNSVHFGFDGAESITLQDVGLGALNYGSWHWASTIEDGTRARVDVTTPGIHNINLWMREDGTNVDRVILSTDPNYTPSGNGPDESAREVTKVRLRAKVYLSGAFDAATGKMRTNLNTGGHLPLSQPYAGVADKTVPADFFANNPRVVDWVWLELRTGMASNTAVHREAFLLRDDGWFMNPSGSVELGINGIEEGAYYIVLGHRNHLSAMTATPRALEATDFKTASLAHNPALAFTTGPAAVQTLVENRIGLWQGDVTGDGVVKYTSASNDRVEVLNMAGGPTAFDFVTGYHLEDVNMDGTVKYAGSNNDRVEILSTSGGPTAFDTKTTEVPD